jgi:invasion protein IalB
MPATTNPHATRPRPRTPARLSSLCTALVLALTGLAETGIRGSAPALAQEPESKQTAAIAQQFAGEVKGQYGDWQYVCKPPPPGAKNEVCALVQSVTAEDRKNVGLTIYFQKFSNGTQVLRVFAPVGVLLPPGIGLKVDGADIGHAPFLRCHTFACYAQVTVEEKLIEQLKTGKTAIFIIFQTEEAGIGIPISLAGFGEGLAALNQ